MRRSSLPFVGFVAILCFLLSAFSFASDGGLRDAVPMVFGSVWYVSTSGNDLTGDGSQDHPFRTIQKGIDSADDGDTVLVEWGVYVENINFSGKRILVASHYIFDGLESTVESTIINGGHAGSVVTFNSGEGLNSVIRGFTLTGGYAVYGGGVYCYGSSPGISENFIVGNECAWGTGGPGIYCSFGSSPSIYRNLVANCSGPAAIFLHVECSARVINNTVCDNTWGGISIQGNSDAYVKNNIFCNNVDYGIHVASGSSWYVGYNDVFGQNNNYVGDIGDQTGIEGNISADPLFENPTAGDYHLTLGSPCIDAGDPPGADMGAFESPQDPNFTITAVPQTAMVSAGDSVSIKLILFSYYGFNSPVILTHSPLPPEVTGFLNPDQLIPTDSSIFRLYTTPDATPGIYPITITADGGEIIHEREVVLGVVPPVYSGPVWYVSTGGNDLIGNGSEEFPFRTIQKGIDVAAGGDTVLVERGTYVEHVNFIGKEILVASHFIFDGLEATVESTVIDGDSSGVVVTFNSGEDASSVIRGFTITNGYTWGLGGGIFCYGSSPTISENFIVGNECGWGRGGPGIYCGHGSGPTIYRNLVANCIGPAAIFLHVECSARVINNTVCDNTWGGISIQGNSDAYVKNNIFCNNVDYGIHVASGSSWYVGYNDVFGQNNNYVGDIGDQTGIEGNISADPLFENPSAGDYHLTLGSPCIDAGDPPGVDMGAFEYSSKEVTEEELKSRSFTLLQNYPNPFNPRTQISYLLPGDGLVRITVFNSLGQRVRVLVDGHQSAGPERVDWDGKDEQGIEVASGIYFYRMEVGGFAQTKKMLLIK